MDLLELADWREKVARLYLSDLDLAGFRRARDDLAEWLVAQGLQVAESDANFVLFGRFTDRHTVWQALLDRGVLIRETGPAGWLRVSAGTPTEMQAFKDALAAVLRTEIDKEAP